MKNNQILIYGLVLFISLVCQIDKAKAGGRWYWKTNQGAASCQWITWAKWDTGNYFNYQTQAKLPMSFTELYTGYLAPQFAYGNNFAQYHWWAASSRTYRWNGNVYESKPGGTIYITPGDEVDNFLTTETGWGQEIPPITTAPPITQEACLAQNPSPCEDEITEAIQACGDLEFVSMDNLETCEWHCSQCDEIEITLQAQCLSGFTLDKKTQDCLGGCKECVDFGQEANSYCMDKGGLLAFTCTDSEDTQAGTQQSINLSYKCVDEDDPTEGPAPVTDPSTPLDPAADPQLDPNNTPDQDNTQYLSAIKSNTDKLVNNSNETNSKLSNIDENIKRGVNNQSVINNSLKDINRQIAYGNQQITSSLGSLNTAIGKLNDLDLNLDLDQLATDANMPGVPDFDSSIQADLDNQGINTAEYDDYELTANEMGDELAIALEDRLSGVSSPLNASVTTQNTSHCLTGSLLFGQSTANMNICFDRPWMLSGYQVMRALFIAVGYFQTFLMLNRVWLGLGNQSI